MQNAEVIFACAIALTLASASPGDAAMAPSVSQIIKETTPHLLTISDRSYYDEDGGDDHGDDDPPPPQARYPQPPEGDVVPEWLPPPRPANCGQYKYWNGAYCADARDEPPYVGPRW
jgi:hypothetical protein